MNKIIILGSGMAGLGAAYHLRENGVEAKIYERNSYHGGNAASFKNEGFTFDVGPHISFTKNEVIQELWAVAVNNKYETFDVSVNNLWKKHWIKHPAQTNLYGLPEDLVVSIIEEFIATKTNKKQKIKSFKDWLYAGFGETFAENFPMKYGHKFHTTTADNMSIDWVGPRVYQPDIKEVLKGALSPTTKDVHYITHFRYPTKGGYMSFLKNFKEDSDITYKHEVIEIDNNMKQLTFSNTTTLEYDNLISSLPLPELIPMIKNTPKKVLTAVSKLACSTCVIVNLGIDRADISEAHWSYFYDDEIIFTRLSFPHMQAKSNAPDGCGSIQAEIYFSNKYKPLKKNPDEFIDDTIKDLKECGLIKKEDTILFKEAKIIPYANVIFDHDRAKNLAIVHNYLDEIGIQYCGRYGEWAYIWTDESFLSGEKAASKVLKEIKS